MKTRNKLLTALAIIAIAVVGIIACNNGDNGTTNPETFTVTFNANGGSPTPSVQTVEKGATATEPTGAQAPTKVNNTLDGWYTEATFTTKWIFATDTVTANIELYAKWIEQPVPASYDLDLKDVKITVHYKKKASEEKPEHLSKIDEVVTAFENSVNSGGLEATAVFNSLKSRDGDYSIKVIYGTFFEGFVPFDWQTLEVHDSWLSADETTLTSPVLRKAFQEMLLKPIPDENGVPYYGKLPNGVKIYKGDDSVTDVQMAAAVTAAIDGYNDIDTEAYGSPDGKFTKIVIFSSTDTKSYTWDGSVLGVRAGRNAAYFTGRFNSIADDSIQLTTED